MNQENENLGQNNESENLTSEESKTKIKPVISKQKLLEAGTYFGHKVALWNPKMKPYIYGKKSGIHIISITKTQEALELAYKIVKNVSQKGANFIFVGTKKQSKNVVEEQAIRTNSAYVSERWLGGTLTNNKTILSRVQELNRLEKLKANNFEGYTKKEGVDFSKKLDKLTKNLNGIRNMKSLPQVMISADPNADKIAILEAKKKKIKVIGILDTNTDPDLVDFGIPANDDSIKSITLIITILADAIMAARGFPTKFAYKEDEEIILPEDQRKLENNQAKNNKIPFKNKNYSRKNVTRRIFGDNTNISKKISEPKGENSNE